jgi:hypothetical protein
MTREYSDKVAEQVQKRTKEIFDIFKHSQHFSNMFKYCQEEAEWVVEELGIFLYNYELIQPNEWSIEGFVGQVYNIERKCMYSKKFFKALPKVIYHFSLFCEENDIGQFEKKEIEKYYIDLKNGELEFHSSWEEAYEARQKQYKSLMGD